MSISKLTNSTKIARVLITALLVLCFLPLAVRLAQSSSITSKAYQTGYQDTSSFRLIDSQWEYYDSETLYKGIPLVGDGNGTYTCYQVGFVGEYRRSVPLQYAFDIYDSSGNTRLYSSVYYDAGQLVNVGLPLVQSTNNIVYRCELYVKLKDGGNIQRTDMYAGAWTWYLNRTTEVSENTLPAEWLETTTYDIDNPLSTVTTVIPSDYDITTQDIDPFLEIPEKITAAMQGCIFWLGRLLNLKYVTFLLCFVLIVGLVAWLIH